MTTALASAPIAQIPAFKKGLEIIHSSTTNLLEKFQNIPAQDLDRIQGDSSQIKFDSQLQKILQSEEISFYLEVSQRENQSLAQVLEKVEQMQTDLTKVQELLIRGVNSNNSTDKVAYLIQGSKFLKQFVIQYWNYFSPEAKFIFFQAAEKILEMSANPGKQFTIKNIITFIKDYYGVLYEYIKSKDRRKVLRDLQGFQVLATAIMNLAENDEDIVDIQDSYEALEEEDISWEEVKANLDL